MTTSKACMRYIMGLSLMLAAPSAHAASATQSKTPEEVADLYLDAWVKLDETRAQELSQYLHEKGERDQSEIFLAIDAVRHLDYDDEARSAFPDVGETAQRRMAAIMKVTAEAVQRSECHALNHTVKPNEYADGQEIFTVNAICKTVTIPNSFSDISVDAIAKMTSEQVSAIVKTIQDTPASRDVNVTVVLYPGDPVPGDTGRPLSTGYAGFSEDVLDKLM